MRKNIFQEISDFTSPFADSEQLVYIEGQKGQAESMEGIEIRLENINGEVLKRFNTYIKKVCRNELTYIRRQEYRSIEKGEPEPHPDIAELAVYIDDGFMKPEFVIMEILDYKFPVETDFADLLNGLSERQRIAFVLNTAFNIPLREIADLFGVSERTVKTYKKQALDKLREGWIDNGNRQA